MEPYRPRWPPPIEMQVAVAGGCTEQKVSVMVAGREGNKVFVHHIALCSCNQCCHATKPPHCQYISCSQVGSLSKTMSLEWK